MTTNLLDVRKFAFLFLLVVGVLLTTQWVHGWTTNGKFGADGQPIGDFDHPANDCGNNWYAKLFPHPLTEQGQCLGQVRKQDMDEALQRRLEQTKTDPGDEEGLIQAMSDTLDNMWTVIREILSKPH
ncbi:MAG: hypothetical protein HY868_16725 [Chloroflexi bacterium]|nr:hypothetical protein [Chloroflexota bacterium]